MFIISLHARHDRADNQFASTSLAWCQRHKMFFRHEISRIFRFRESSEILCEPAGLHPCEFPSDMLPPSSGLHNFWSDVVDPDMLWQVIKVYTEYCFLASIET